MLNVLNLVQLNHLSKPSFVRNEMSLCTDSCDMLFELVEVDGNVIDSREDIGEEAIDDSGKSVWFRSSRYGER